MKGYYNNENATKNTLITHDDGKIWLHTGDYGYMTEEGLIYLLGRVDRLIKNYKNEQIDVFEIEKIIEENENVENCIVVGARDKENKQGEVPIANIVLKNIDIDANIVKNQIIQNCEKKLKEGKRPVEYRMLDKMPLTRLNKIDYEELRRQCNEEKENIVKVKKLTR